MLIQINVLLMKNVNYNLVKLLHSTLDDIWRLEKFYVEDAKKAGCHSKTALEKILENKREHARMLREEIKMRMDAGIFD